MKHPIFNRRHYVAIAELLKQKTSEAFTDGEVASIAWSFIHMFEKDNPKFDRKRFMNACGVFEENN